MKKTKSTYGFPPGGMRWGGLGSPGWCGYPFSAAYAAAAAAAAAAPGGAPGGSGNPGGIPNGGTTPGM